MRLLTLNAHSRPGAQDAVHIPRIAAWIRQAAVDVIALQEVNQSRSAEAVSEEELKAAGALLPLQGAPPVGQDNFALGLARALNAEEGTYHWCYLPIKLGYDVYDEGLALLWRGEARSVHVLPLSHTRDYNDWRRRMALGVKLGEEWFYSVHTSRWEDAQEPFVAQWERLCRGVRDRGGVFLLGDFNCPAHRTGQGYDRMIRDGWHDTFTAAAASVGYATAASDIDGWDYQAPRTTQRIDYILTNRSDIRVTKAQTVFDPARGEEAVSDHCGVFCVYEEVRS